MFVLKLFTIFQQRFRFTRDIYMSCFIFGPFLCEYIFHYFTGHFVHIVSIYTSKHLVMKCTSSFYQKTLILNFSFLFCCRIFWPHFLFFFHEKFLIKLKLVFIKNFAKLFFILIFKTFDFFI